MSGLFRGRLIEPLVSQWSQAATPPGSTESIFRGGRRVVAANSLPAVPLLSVEV